MITPFYAGLLALMYLVLSVLAIRMRRKLQIAVGHDDNEEMLRAMRVHSNFAEYVPITLILILLLEIGGGDMKLLHALGMTLIAGRLIHAYGVSMVNEDHRFRVAGMCLTFIALITSAVANILISKPL